MRRHGLTLACLIGAVLCYLLGAAEGVIAFVITGLILESLFWFRLFRRR